MFKSGTGGWRYIIADGVTTNNTMLLIHPDVTVLIDKDADQ